MYKKNFEKEGKFQTHSVFWEKNFFSKNKRIKIILRLPKMAATSGGHAGTTSYANVATTTTQDYNLADVSNFVTKWFQLIGLNRNNGKKINFDFAIVRDNIAQVSNSSYPVLDSS